MLEISDVPVLVWAKKQCLCRNSGLATKARWQLACWPSHATIALDVQKEPGELELSIPEAVDDADSIALQNLPRLYRGRFGD
jgi:hypothetical protein